MVSTPVIHYQINGGLYVIQYQTPLERHGNLEFVSRSDWSFNHLFAFWHPYEASTTRCKLL